MQGRSGSMLSRAQTTPGRRYPPRSGRHSTMSSIKQPELELREEGALEAPSRDLCREMFEKVTEYLNGELAVTIEEYQLLLKLNQMSLAKYSDMSALAGRLNEVSQRLSDKLVSLQPYCDLIDQVESSVSALEQTAYRLDAYCKRLEAKFRELEK